MPSNEPSKGSCARSRQDGLKMNSLVCARQTGKIKTALVSLMALVMVTARGEDVGGHYVLHGVMEVGSELLLKSDGSFEYMLVYGAADFWAKGTWRHQDNSVVLTSAGKKEAPFRFLRSEAGTPGKICVWVMGKDGHGVENIQVALQTVDQHFEATTTSDGAAVFPGVANARAVAFEVPVYSLKAGPFEIKPSDNDFYFEINGDAITEVLFQDEELAIDGKDLVMKYWNAEQPMRYEKQ
jgi:hypothetical protein